MCAATKALGCFSSIQAGTTSGCRQKLSLGRLTRMWSCTSRGESTGFFCEQLYSTPAWTAYLCAKKSPKASS